MKTVLIHHEGVTLDAEVMTRWLASFTDLAGIIVLVEGRSPRWRRARRELERSGVLGFLDVVAFRLYSRVALSRRDRRGQAEAVERLLRRFPQLPESTAVLRTQSPNSPESVEFIEALSPDLMIARCKVLLKERVFSLPALGTFVMHPGIAPEYRNSHGCFWALANRDLDCVGMTLLRIDKGVDTGPVYGYFTYDFDERSETHTAIQTRVVYENLEPLRERLLEIEQGAAEPIDTAGRPSRVWGQPWLTKYVRWKVHARRNAARVVALGYHDVVVDGAPDSSGFPGGAAAHYKLGRTQFAAHLDALSAEMSRPPVQVDDRGARLHGAQWLLTFDDGGASAVDVGEALVRRGWRGHFFVPTDFIGTPGFLDADQIRALRGAGHAVGSHSCSHPDRMSRCTQEELEHEWCHSVSVLSDIVGEPVTVASVPGGYYSEEVARVAARAGIRTLFTSEPVSTIREVDGCRVVGRYSVRASTPVDGVVELVARRPIPRMRQFVAWNGKKVAKAIGGETYLRLRRILLARE